MPLKPKNPGRFAALVDSDESDDGATSPNDEHVVDVPSYEDLSSSRADEETVLQAIYGSDYSFEEGTWGQKILKVKVRPPDLDATQIGCNATVATQIPKRYPYCVPKIELQDVKGLSKNIEKMLMDKLKERAVELSEVGSVMVCELVQVVEDFLLEHNVNPSMSAWEQMKAREAKEQAAKEEEERAKKKQIQTLIDAEQSSNDYYSNNSTTVYNRTLSSLKSARNNEDGFRSPLAPTGIEKELARQREAIEEANKYRMKNNGIFMRQTPIESSSATNSDEYTESEENEFDDDDEAHPAVFAGSSRYHTDFIELGILGRGGGGEVVKVKNRLDRRIYAIKKILLESEKGSSAKFGEIHNKKLRREVTTISSMTHKNIVRYYQAWVEGSDIAESVLDENEDIDNSDATEDFLKARLEDESEDSEDSRQRWWTKPPREENPSLSTRNERLGTSKSDGSDNDDYSSSSSWSDEDEGQFGIGDSMSDDRFLSKNLNFNNQYESLFKNGQDSAIPGSGCEERSNKSCNSDDSSDLWEESSVKVDHSKKQSLLYIQMEYCSTTLRKLIDENAFSDMSQSDIWRLVRQIVEALCYIHNRRIIHRDLVSDVLL